MKKAELRAAGGGDGSDGADADDADGDEAAGLDIHDLLEALSAHLHEHHDAIVKWPWKLFCRKWARLIDWAADEEERKENERIEREFADLKRAQSQHGG